MALRIETFSNLRGGNSFFKAVGHPLVVPKVQDLLGRLERSGSVAVYDPLGYLDSLAQLYALRSLPVVGVFAQGVEQIGTRVLGHETQPITEIQACRAATVLVAAFDTEALLRQIRHLLPEGAEIATLDALRLPQEMLSNRRHYLDPLNFATNFAFFRDARGRHTRLTTANYWSGYGATDSSLWLCLFDEEGRAVAQWREPLPRATGTVLIDSREIRRRFGLGDFTGSLFLHVIGVAGHDVVKYALDTYGEDRTDLSCTHDANAWPSDQYAGLPAPAAGEKVILWVQNSHPCPIPPRGMGLNRMGTSEIAWLDREIPPFGTLGLDVSRLLPKVHWPEQIEVQAGKHFVRPRYEVFAENGRSRMAHANVERIDLEADPRIAKLGPWLGKAYLLPAPVLPPARFRSLVLPTPMASCQEELPIRLVIYDASGRECASHRFGMLSRKHSVAVGVQAVLEETGTSLDSGYGHMELMYDLSLEAGMDGWLHALFRYEDKHSGHVAETSFGAHIFNTILTYKDEPQSYAGRPPGLSTRLFLRLGSAPSDTLCHLIYPASTAWHAHSTTRLVLHDRTGAELAERTVRIRCSGSLLWRYSAMFTDDERREAGAGAYVLVRDSTCRLFGYHGLLNGDVAFSLDHMFGF